VESGEGIESCSVNRSPEKRPDDVESGEGIERSAVYVLRPLNIEWNPVKELKAYCNYDVDVHDSLWNPVKELKESHRLQLKNINLNLWNPVKELKVRTCRA